MNSDNWAIDDFGLRGSDKARVAIKDVIDIEGYKTSAGSRVVLSNATVAKQDARCIEGLRSKDVAFVGKANLVELAFGTSGINHWWGTPVNPIDASCVPGGSSSGSAVAVANKIADFALGTDTGGSIRIPAAACGIMGLKTTWSRISLVGVWPLARSLDTVGPMATSVSGLVEGLTYLDPNTTLVSIGGPIRVALVTDSQPKEMTDLFRTLFTALKWEVTEIASLDLASVNQHATKVLLAEALRADGQLLAEAHRLDPVVATRLRTGIGISDIDFRAALDERHRWSNQVDRLFDTFDVLALASVPKCIPSLSSPYSVLLNTNTLPFNFSGNPAISLPVSLDFTKDTLRTTSSPQGGSPDKPIPVSLQLVGHRNSEEKLLALAQIIESASLLFTH